MQEVLRKLEAEFDKDCAAAASAEDVEALRVKYLGRKSVLSDLFRKIPSLPATQRGACGRQLNVFKDNLASRLDMKKKAIETQRVSFDVTLPAGKLATGSRHILGSVSEKICSIFERLGFLVIEGSEIEDEWHNFEALNFPADHPSRDDFDTFYLDLAPGSRGKYLLRCHTSPSQIRIMQQAKPPLAVISPGRVYRPDQVDATHSFMFNQIEGFAVSADINFAHLKGVLLAFAREFFSATVRLRFRPHFFPFTEPSAEVDISCFACEGKTSANKTKCSLCKDKGWLEILGCGMIHPRVLKSCGINAKKYRGFAFGMGVDRIAMLKYGIEDIRLFYENDVRFLEQFTL